MVGVLKWITQLNTFSAKCRFCAAAKTKRNRLCWTRLQPQRTGFLLYGRAGTLWRALDEVDTPTLQSCAALLYWSPSFCLHC